MGNKQVQKSVSVAFPAQKGFTLIEIMVVVAIIAILGATVVPLIMDRPNEARVVRAKNDIGNYSAALGLYKLDKTQCRPLGT